MEMLHTLLKMEKYLLGEKKSAATGLSLPYASWKIQYQR